MLKSQKGFSLPELMVAMGLLGGISIVTMKMVDNQSSNEAYIKGRAEISKAVSSLKLALNNSDNCRQMLGGGTRILAPGGSIPLTTLAVPFKRNNVLYTKTYLEANKLYPGFETKAITLSRPVTAGPNTGLLEISFSMRNRNMKLWSAVGVDDPSDRIITEKIPIIVNYKPDLPNQHLITDCGPVVSAANATAKQKLCESLGNSATWDSTNDRCIFNNLTCPFGKILVSMTSVGGGHCKDIHEAIQLRDLFSDTPCTWQTGSFRIGEVGGKLQVICQ